MSEIICDVVSGKELILRRERFVRTMLAPLVTCAYYRSSMSLVLENLETHGIAIQSLGCVAKIYPDQLRALASLSMQLEEWR
jgi:hypothetical protein